MYVSAAETSLRDRVATIYGKVGTVRNGERVEVLEKQKRFLRVRAAGGQEGWIEERSLVPQQVYDGFQQLAKDNASVPAQGHGATRAELNMHLTPARDGEKLYQLKEGEKLEILKRTTTDKNARKPPLPTKTPAGPKVPPAPIQGMEPKSPGAKPSDSKTAGSPGKGASGDALKEGGAKAGETGEAAPPKPIMEDWYLVRDSKGRAGWVLLRMVDLDVPLDIAQYAEGQRITGYFMLNTVEETTDEGTKTMPQYLVLLNEPKDGLVWDYNQVRVFTRNRNRHRYETAYRERNIEGYLPVKVGHQEFDKEGDLPTFTIRKKNDAGQVVETTYRLIGPIVRRVLSPEEQAAEKAKHDAEVAARKQAAEQARAKRAATPRKPNATHQKKH